MTRFPQAPLAVAATRRAGSRCLLVGRPEDHLTRLLLRIKIASRVTGGGNDVEFINRSG